MDAAAPAACLPLLREHHCPSDGWAAMETTNSTFVVSFEFIFDYFSYDFVYL